MYTVFCVLLLLLRNVHASLNFNQKFSLDITKKETSQQRIAHYNKLISCIIKRHFLPNEEVP